MLTRRLQILLDDRRYRRLHAEARARRASVGALVRDAIDRAFRYRRLHAEARARRASVGALVRDAIDRA
ncbi:MAG: hypothetical protein AUH67_00215, partial [Chloroflexi bacterium 13_1_40CM_4_69_19]